MQTVTAANGAYEISLNGGSDPAAAIREITSTVPTARVELHRPTLEDVFVQLVLGSGAIPSDDLDRMRASLREDSRVEVEA